MTYIIKRKDRFYVVAYDGLDPLTGRERRRWHAAGTERSDAESIATRLASSRPSRPDRRASLLLGGFITQTWLPRKRTHVRATTAHRYGWIVEHYVLPRLGDVALRSLRSDHLDDLYEHLLARGGRDSQPLAPKTVHEAHLVVRNALELAVHRQLVDRNVALAVHSPRRRGGGTTVARVWTAQELATFLAFAQDQRLYPALHLTAHTGMRRGEVTGLKWADFDANAKRISICRTIQSLAGRPVEFGAKTRTSRRCVDLDDTTVELLQRWRRTLKRDRLPHSADDWMFCNTTGRFLNPESISQLFVRTQRRSGLPRIRFHDLRHTHASLLVANGVPIKVVTERLGHAHPAFTMHTYQHLLPGMSAEAATRFADLVAAAPVDVYRPRRREQPGQPACAPSGR